MQSVSRALRSTERSGSGALQTPGPLRTPSERRSRIQRAPLRCASCCTTSGKTERISAPRLVVAFMPSCCTNSNSTGGIASAGDARSRGKRPAQIRSLVSPMNSNAAMEKDRMRHRGISYLLENQVR